MRKILLVAMLLVLSGCAVNVVTDSNLEFGNRDGAGPSIPSFIGPLPDMQGSVYKEGQDI